MFRRRRREDADRSGPEQAVTQDEAEVYDDAGADDQAEFADHAEFADDAEFDDSAEFDDDLTGSDAAEVGRPRRTASHRRGRRRGTGEPATGEPGTGAPGTSQDDAGAGAAGPWDGAGSYPARERMDFGSLLVPPREGLDIQINMAEDQGVWIAIVRGDSALQLQAFAAPKTSGLWDEVRQEIAEEVTKSGGDSAEGQGPFGTELRARINPAPAPGQRRQQLQQVRFLGVDGPRWFLRGLISGPAAHRPELSRPFEEIFADVVVVRGDHPAPPRDLLEIRLPEDARRALEEQMAEAGENPDYPNPFERGPEITETR